MKVRIVRNFLTHTRKVLFPRFTSNGNTCLTNRPQIHLFRLCLDDIGKIPDKLIFYALVSYTISLTLDTGHWKEAKRLKCHITSVPWPFCGRNAVVSTFLRHRHCTGVAFSHNAKIHLLTLAP